MGLNYHGTLCDLKFSRYYNENIRLDLVDSHNGLAVATATVNLEFRLPDNYVMIKNYSENEGMLEFLIKEGVVSKPIDAVRSGFVVIPICELLIPPIFN